MIDRLDAKFFDQGYFTNNEKSHYSGDYENDRFKEAYRRVFTQIARRELHLGQQQKKVLEIGAAYGETLFYLKENIDHIVLSENFANNFKFEISEWNIDKNLSDHKGICLKLIQNE